MEGACCASAKARPIRCRMPGGRRRYRNRPGTDMHAFKDKVAVITGAAGGLGLALARHAASLGMRLVLADVDEAALAHACESLRAQSAHGGTPRAEVIAQRTDVSDPAQV